MPASQMFSLGPTKIVAFATGTGPALWRMGLAGGEIYTEESYFRPEILFSQKGMMALVAHLSPQEFRDRARADHPDTR